MMRPRLAIVSLVIALIGGGCDWAQWGGGSSRAGTNAFENGLTKDTVGTLAATTVSDAAPTGQVVATRHRLFVPRDGTLTAYDTHHLGVQWVGALPEGSTVGSAPAVAGESRTVFLVVAGPSNPVLVGFDMDGVRNCNLVLNWCSPIFRADLGTTPGPPTPPAVAGGRVFANGSASLYAFDAAGQTGCSPDHGVATCEPLWSAPTAASETGIGPAVADDVVYTAVAAVGLGAFDAGTGQSLWTGALGTSAVSATPSVGSGSVFVPAGASIEVFTANGCGAPTCTPTFTLDRRTSDPADSFLATPAVSGSKVFATNANGALYAWADGGCAASRCEPAWAETVHSPSGGSTGYAQAPAVVTGIVYVTAQRAVSGADHAVVVALDESDLTELDTWDLGPGGPGPGLASVSVAWSSVYAPIDGGLVRLRRPPARPLASLTVSPLSLAPAFSPSTSDYALRCTAATNPVTIDMSAVAGGSVQLIAPTTTAREPSQTVPVELAENQAAVVRAFDSAGAFADYWIRCLPRDFPPMSATRSGDGPTPGWYVVGNNVNLTAARSYAMILDTNGTPVWYGRATPAGADNVTPLDANTVAFWQTTRSTPGYSVNPDGHFDTYALDTGQEDSIRTVGVPADFHELHPLPNGNRLLLSYALTGGVDLTGLAGNPTPGEGSTIADCIVQEIDPQGSLVWQWIGSEHLDPKTETTQSPVDSVTIDGTPVYDVFHCNSIDVHPNGNVLVSARHLNAIFEIRRSDDKVAWKMGGTPTNRDGAAIVAIENDPYGGVVQQHDARYLPNGNITLFDNQAAFTGNAARAIEFDVDVGAGRAEPVFSFAAAAGTNNCCMGSFRRYSDGHSVVGWGLQLPPAAGLVLTELDEDGNEVFEIADPGRASYRAVKVPTSRFDVGVLRAAAGR
jgi:hypothetical protein